MAELTPVVLGPGAHGSPDPSTSGLSMQTITDEKQDRENQPPSLPRKKADLAAYAAEQYNLTLDPEAMSRDEMLAAIESAQANHTN